MPNSFKLLLRAGLPSFLLLFLFALYDPTSVLKAANLESALPEATEAVCCPFCQSLPKLVLFDLSEPFESIYTWFLSFSLV